MQNLWITGVKFIDQERTESERVIMNAVNDKKELPYIPLGIFKLRLPGIHYKLEYVEFLQGLIIGTTALASLPYLTDYMGLPYELAWSCVIIETFMYMLHVTGWITPTLPLTLAYLSGFEKGPERTQAMIALQLLVAAVFLFMGITKLAEKFVSAIPTSIKGGILLAAPITVMQNQFSEDGQLMKYPVAVLVGTARRSGRPINFWISWQNSETCSRICLPWSLV